MYSIFATLAAAGILLGAISLVFDWGGRFFGSYPRNPFVSAAAVVVQLALYASLLSPLYAGALNPGSAACRLLLPFGVLGYVLTVFYLFPYRFGIVRQAAPNAGDTAQPILDGAVLRRAVIEYPGLPSGAGSCLRCLVLSDLHCDGELDLAFIGSMLEQVRAFP
jgi:hypothetical protein